MDNLESQIKEGFKEISSNVSYVFENNAHSVRIVSESFENLQLIERMNQVMKCLRKSENLLKLDLTYDFNFILMTPKELETD